MVLSLNELYVYSSFVSRIDCRCFYEHQTENFYPRPRSLHFAWILLDSTYIVFVKCIFVVLKKNVMKIMYFRCMENLLTIISVPISTHILLYLFIYGFTFYPFSYLTTFARIHMHMCTCILKIFDISKININ